jgi:endonuclease YncB( thermonuclease family)
VVIQNDKRKEETVHLAGIDAPERDQPDGIYAQEQLAKFIAGKEVRVDAKEQSPTGMRIALQELVMEAAKRERVGD